MLAGTQYYALRGRESDGPVLALALALVLVEALVLVLSHLQDVDTLGWHLHLAFDGTVGRGVGRGTVVPRGAKSAVLLVLGTSLVQTLHTTGRHFALEEVTMGRDVGRGAVADWGAERGTSQAQEHAAR